jgi:hypothetical protein
MQDSKSGNRDPAQSVDAAIATAEALGSDIVKVSMEKETIERSIRYCREVLGIRRE